MYIDMKNFRFIGAFLCFCMFACSKQYVAQQREIDSQDNVMCDFAVVLSKAIHENAELRDFLKSEAISMFDYDYDVFYQWEKGKFVNSKETFEDILTQYDRKGIIGTIGEEIPLLNILIPNWGWIDDECFDVNSWDTTSDNVSVAVDDRRGHALLYNNGKLSEVVPYSLIPSSPVLILKENERLRPVVTKSGSVDFEFISSAFNASLETKAYRSEFDSIIDLEIEHGSEFDDHISGYYYGGGSGRLFHAFSVANSVSGLTQRDYVYYGLDGEHSSGTLDVNFHETIRRIKFEGTPSGLFDNINDYSATGYTTSEGYSLTQLQQMIWFEGAIELRFLVFAGPEWDNEIGCSVNFSQAYAVSKVLKYRNYNWIGMHTSDYYGVTIECIEPKWFNVNIPLFSWDISKYPERFKIRIVEQDPSGTIEITRTISDNFLTNFNIEIADIIKIGFGNGNLPTQDRPTTYHYIYNEESDSLGSFDVYYYDEIAMTQPMLGGGANTMPKIYSTGFINMVVFPSYN